MGTAPAQPAERGKEARKAGRLRAGGVEAQGPLRPARASPPPEGKSCKGVAWAPHTFTSDSSFIGAWRPPPGKAGRSPPKTHLLSSPGSATGTRSAPPAPAPPGPHWPPFTQGKGCRSQTEEGLGGGTRTVRMTRWHRGPQESVSSRRRSLARGTARGCPLPPVPSVGHNNLKDKIDISTLYNNIS